MAEMSFKQAILKLVSLEGDLFSYWEYLRYFMMERADLISGWMNRCIRNEHISLTHYEANSGF